MAIVHFEQKIPVSKIGAVHVRLVSYNNSMRLDLRFFAEGKPTAHGCILPPEQIKALVDILQEAYNAWSVL